MKKKDIRKIAAFLMAAMLLLSAVSVFGHDAPTTATVDTKLGIKTIDELNGLELGVQTSVLYEDLIKDRIPEANWHYYTMPNDMILAVEANKISAYLIEDVGFVAQYAQHPELVAMDEVAGVCEYKVVIGNNERQELLTKQMNEFIKKSHENGFLDDLYDYWVMNFDAETCVIRSKLTFTYENGPVDIGIEGGYEPFSFESKNEYSDFSGFDVEFMLNFCAEYGYEPVFHSVPFESIAPAAETGKYDFGMNIVYSDEREETATLSDTYYSCDIVFVLEGLTESNMTFFEKIANSFTKTFIKDNRWKLFLSGIGTTVLITLCSVVFGTILGFLAYMACRHGNKVANKINGFLNWLIEGMPTVVFLMILYYIIFGNTKMSGTVVSIVGFSLIFACSMYDMLEVGCNAVGKGQVEASRALGYSDRQSFFKVILPQAAQHFLPIYRNEIVTLIKETSVVGYIAVMDLTKMSDLVRSRTYEAFFPLISTAIIYFIIAGIMVRVVRGIQISIDPKHRNKDKILEGVVIPEDDQYVL